MIPLQPELNVEFLCPYCSERLAASGWRIVGTWSFAELSCFSCGHHFFGELPVGLARQQQHLIDKASGQAWGPEADFYSATYMKRIDRPIRIQTEVKEPMSKVLLLNCIDWIYGHSLLKLLNAQRHLDALEDVGLVVLIPEKLRWLVPDGVAQVWSVDISHPEALLWNDGFAQEIRRLADPFDTVSQSRALSHPHPSEVEISRFSRVLPFPVSKWSDLPPAITYVWRDDRTWPPPRLVGRWINSLLYRLNEPWSSRFLLSRQQKAIRRLFKLLRDKFQSIDLAVVGFGEYEPSVEGAQISVSASPSRAIEHEWCERYARSHVVVGVHGSNMLLASAHAGAVVELIPQGRWGNAVQDLIPARHDARAAIYCYRNLPIHSPVGDVLECVHSLMRDHDFMMDEFAARDD